MTWIIIGFIVFLIITFLGEFLRYANDPEYRKLCDSEMRNYEKRKKL